MITQDDKDGIKISVEQTLEISKNVLGGQHAPGEYEVQRDVLNDLVAAVKTIIGDYEDQMESFKKQKRRIDDQISELKVQMRPWKAYKEDLQEQSKRHNNAFWDAKREMQSRNLPT